MEADSLTSSAIFLTGTVVVISDEEIEVVAGKISDRLLAGAAFAGLHQAIYDEVPAVFVEILGLRFVLQGYAGEHYILECFPSPELSFPSGNVEKIDISEHIARSLGDITGMTVKQED